MNVTLNGVTLPLSEKIRVEPIPIYIEARTASGRLVRDVIADKWQVTIPWKTLASSEIEPILAQLESKTFHQLTYPHLDGANKTITAALDGGIGGDIVYPHDVGGERYWENVSLTFIEQ